MIDVETHQSRKYNRSIIEGTNRQSSYQHLQAVHRPILQHMPSHYHVLVFHTVHHVPTRRSLYCPCGTWWMALTVLSPLEVSTLNITPLPVVWYTAQCLSRLCLVPHSKPRADDVFLCSFILVLCCCVLPIVLAVFIFLYVITPPLVIAILGQIKPLQDVGTWSFLERADLYARADTSNQGHEEEAFFVCKKGWFRAFLIGLLLCLLGWIPGILWSIGITIYAIYRLFKHG